MYIPNLEVTNMRCSSAQGQFSEIYDGVAQRQNALLRHIKNCPDCAREYAEYKQMLDDVYNLPVPELPEGFHEAIMGKISEIIPPSDHAIDSLLQDIESRKRGREAKAKMHALRKRTAASRWSGVAAAACLLFACIWALNTLDMPASRADYELIPAMPYAAMDDIAIAAPAAEEAEYWAYSDYDTDDSQFWGAYDAEAEAEPSAVAADFNAYASEQAEDALPGGHRRIGDDAAYDSDTDNVYLLPIQADAQIGIDAHHDEDAAQLGGGQQDFAPAGIAYASTHLPQAHPRGLANEATRNWSIVATATALGLCMAIVAIVLSARNKKLKRG